MYGPAQSILWQLWRRNRLGLIIVAAYLVVAVILARLLPAEISYPAIDAEPMPLPVVLAFPCIYLGIYLASVFVSATPDVKDSGFPRHWFILPATTLSLTLWPMVYGAITVACVWWIVVLGLLWPSGMAPALWWPAASAAAAMAMIQLIAWAPLASPWLRIVLAIPIFLAPAAACAAASLLELSEAWIVAIMLSMIGIAWAVSVAAVSRARRGEMYDQWLVDRFAAWRASRARPVGRPFSSATRAQLWFDWRAHGWLLPGLTAGWLALTILVLFQQRGDEMLTAKLLGGVLLLPTLSAMFLGASIGRQDIRSKYPLPSFTGARPLSSAALVRSKMTMAAISSLAAHALVACYLPLVFFIRPVTAETLASLTAGVPTWKIAAALAGGWLVLVLQTWLTLAQNLWVGLQGRPWVTNCTMLVGAVLFGGGAVLGIWIYLHTAAHQAFFATLPWLAAAAVAAKLGSAAWVLNRSQRADVLSRTQMAGMLAIWSLASLAVFAGMRWELAERLSLPATVAIAALAIPLTSLIAAPLALDWNRHR